MIKWPLLDYNTAGSTAGSLLIGREKEIDELFDDLKMRNGSIRLIIGESGVGKSALLDDLHRRLTEVENQKNQFFVGYYSSGDMKLKIEMNLEGKSCYPVYCRVNACGLSFVMGQNRSFAKRKTDFTPKGIFHPINIVLPRIRYW